MSVERLLLAKATGSSRPYPVICVCRSIDCFAALTSGIALSGAAVSLSPPYPRAGHRAHTSSPSP